jgi:hypothetical protein
VTENPGDSSESSQGSDDPFDIEFDEDFIKAATTKEPSARARELSARWSKEPPKDTGWRSDTPDPLHQPPSGDSFDADDADDAEQAAPRARRVWPRNLVIALAAAAAVGYLVYPRHQAGSSPLGAIGTTQPQIGPVSRPPIPAPTATATATATPSFTNPDDQYFADSPSLGWANNEAGIVEPAAAAVGTFAASEVAAGYDGLRELLIAGNLDSTVLGGGPVTDFTALLDTRSHLSEELSKWISHPGFGANAIDLVTRFNPTTTRLLGHTVKVQGTMSAAIGKSGFLTVTGDYKFVYAVSPGNGDGRPTRAVVHRVYVVELDTPGVFDAQTGKYWLSDYASDVANSACNDYNGYVNPAFGAGGGASGKTVDPYASSNLLTSSPSPRPTGSTPPACDSVSRL